MELWKVDRIGFSDDALFEALITAEDGTKLIAQIAKLETANYIVEMHNSRLTKRALDGARFCPACHALLEEGSVYCDTCGTDTPRQ